MKTLFCQKPASSKMNNIIGLALLSYSLLSPLIKHAMILNMLRRYQLSPPPSVMVKTRANFSLLLTQSEPGVRSSASGKLRLFVGLWEGNRGHKHTTQILSQYLRADEATCEKIKWKFKLSLNIKSLLNINELLLS